MIVAYLLSSGQILHVSCGIAVLNSGAFCLAQAGQVMWHYLVPLEPPGAGAAGPLLVIARVSEVAISSETAEPPDPAVVRDLLGPTLGEARVAALVGSGIALLGPFSSRLRYQRSAQKIQYLQRKDGMHAGSSGGELPNPSPGRRLQSPHIPPSRRPPHVRGFASGHWMMRPGARSTNRKNS